MNLSWIAEVNCTDEEMKDILREEHDLLTLYQILQNKSGKEAFFFILNEFAKTKVVFNYRPILKLKRKYVEQHSSLPCYLIARKIDIHERTVQKWIEEFKNKITKPV